MSEDSARNTHSSQPPLSPRLHSLPDNVLSPLGLLAEASLQNTEAAKKDHGPFGGRAHRPSPLSLEASRSNTHKRNGSGGSYRMATSDVRGGKAGHEDEYGYGGVASQNYFKPGVFVVFLLSFLALSVRKGAVVPVPSGASDDKVSFNGFQFESV